MTSRICAVGRNIHMLMYEHALGASLADTPGRRASCAHRRRCAGARRVRRQDRARGDRPRPAAIPRWAPRRGAPTARRARHAGPGPRWSAGGARGPAGPTRVIVLDTTVLVYAVGAEHPLRDPCRRLVEAIADGQLGQPRRSTSSRSSLMFAHAVGDGPMPRASATTTPSSWRPSSPSAPRICEPVSRSSSTTNVSVPSTRYWRRPRVHTRQRRWYRPIARSEPRSRRPS